MLILFFVQLLVVFVLVHVKRISLLEPIPVFSFSWLISASLLLTGVLIYDQVFSIASFSIVSASLWAFVVGALVLRSHKKRRQMQYGLDQKYRLKKGIYKPGVVAYSRPIIFVFISGLSIYLLLLIVNFNNLGIADDLLALDYGSIRHLKWEIYRTGIKGTGDLVLTATRSIAVVSAVTTPFYFFYKSRLPYYRTVMTVGVLSCFGLLFETMIDGGRALITTVIIAVIWGYAYTRFEGRLYLNAKGILKRVFSTRFVIGIVFFFFLISILLVWVPRIRNTNLLTNYDEYMYRATAGAHIGENADLVRSLLGDETALYLIRSTSYFMDPIPILTLYYESSNFTEWYFLGAYSFPYFSKFMDIVLGERFSYLAIREKVGAVTLSLGHGEFHWATGIRDLLIDFGSFGTVILIGIFGYLCQGVFSLCQKKGFIAYKALASLMAILSFRFAYHGTFSIGYLVFPILICLGLISLRSFGSMIRYP